MPQPAETPSASGVADPAAVTLVTGASSGIGRRLAQQLAARGRPVALIARRAVELDRAAAEIAAAGGQVLAVAADVTDRAALARAVARVEAELGPIECVVANAGGGHRLAAVEFDAGRFAEGVQLNLIGVANCVEATLGRMRARGRGHFVAVGSLAGRLGLPQASAYSAAKAGVARLMTSLRAELADEPIAITLIEPGFVDARDTGERGRRRKPFRWSLDRACKRMVRAIERRQSICAFPVPLVMLIAWLRVLPTPVYNVVVRRLAQR